MNAGVQSRAPIAAAPEVSGNCRPRFAAVREAFARNFTEHGETGAACAVWYDGSLAIDLWGGYADAAQAPVASRNARVLHVRFESGYGARVRGTDRAFERAR